MLDDIKNKVKNDPFCELSIDELIELNKLDDYNEYVKIFGKKFVAQSPEEITIDIICYVGNLVINDILPTYNLKYIFGGLEYRLDKIHNLENLCFIGFNFTFNKCDDLSDLSELFENKEFILYAVEKDGFALKYAKNFQNDKEVVLKAVKKDGCSLEYASEELKNDKEVVLEAVKQYNFAFESMSEKLKNDREFLLELLKQNNDVFPYIPGKFINDKDFLLKAVKLDKKLFDYLSYYPLNNDILLELERDKTNSNVYNDSKDTKKRNRL